jgi:hypothetical protein
LSSRQPTRTLSSARASSPDVDAAQRMRHRACGFSADVGVLGVGLGRSRMQVGDPAHWESGKICHVDAVRGPP